MKDYTHVCAHLNNKLLKPTELEKLKRFVGKGPQGPITLLCCDECAGYMIADPQTNKKSMSVSGHVE